MPKIMRKIPKWEFPNIRTPRILAALPIRTPTKMEPQCIETAISKTTKSITHSNRSCMGDSISMWSQNKSQSSMILLQRAPNFLEAAILEDPGVKGCVLQLSARKILRNFRHYLAARGTIHVSVYTYMAASINHFQFGIL